ncbi:MAG: PBP1A family penicillin-binding protein [Candidatus Dadabacteria bacterium]|nr:PBP1A family penicillin-binding protein [Candidatus Dadabacteria bacterium]
MAKKKKVKFKTKRTKSKLLAFLFLSFFILLTAAALAIYGGYLYYTRDLPDFRAVTGYRPKLITEVYSSDGTLIAEFAAERRKLIAYEDIPPRVIEAFIAIEDRRFFEHEGVDIKSILGAVFENIQEGDWVRGASTITQQVIKNIILTPERTMTRKIKEAILAHRIENNLSKQEILYLYLNHIYLADGNYGIEAASRSYFGKPARDMTLAEAALLAGLPKKPEYFSPRKHLDRAIERQKLVLSKMEEAGFITRDERFDALDQGIKIVPRQRINNDIAPYFVEHVRRYLQDKVGVKDFINGGYTVFTTLDIDLNLEAQWALRRGILDLEARHGRKVVSKSLGSAGEIRKFRDKQGIKSVQPGEVYEAVVTRVVNVDNPGPAKKTKKDDESAKEETARPVYNARLGIGDVEGRLIFAVSSPYGKAVPGFDTIYSKKLAPAGGYDGVSLTPVELKVGDVVRVLAKETTDGGFDYSLAIEPIAQGALISMESTGKIRAMAGGYDFDQSQFNRTMQALRQPGSSFKPMIYSAALDKGYTETSILYDMPVVVKDWAPRNYDGSFDGPMLLRKALARSRNLATIRLIMDIDPKYAVKYAKNFGFTSKLNPYPSLALGGSEVRVVEMAKAFNVFASGGKLVEPQFILRIYDRNGIIIEDNTGGKFISREEALKVERENARLEVLNEIARKAGRGSVETPGYLKEEELTARTAPEPDKYAFLSPDEFLELIKSGAADFTSPGNAKQTLSPETAFIMTDLLQAVVSEGTGRRALKLTSLAPVAGKTGTTNDFTDAWFVGYSPRITTAVWVGRDDHKPLGKKESGSLAALPIWVDYMEDALARYPGGSFKQPSGIKVVSTPYGSIPYSLDSLRHSVIDSIRDSVMINGQEMIKSPEGIYYPADYEKGKSETETEIDFLMRN